MSDSFAVEFKNVTKAFGDVQAVRNLNFSIEKGQLVTLLGPSGCGLSLIHISEPTRPY